MINVCYHADDELCQNCIKHTLTNSLGELFILPRECWCSISDFSLGYTLPFRMSQAAIDNCIALSGRRYTFVFRRDGSLEIVWVCDEYARFLDNRCVDSFSIPDLSCIMLRWKTSMREGETFVRDANANFLCLSEDLTLRICDRRFFEIFNFGRLPVKRDGLKHPRMCLDMNQSLLLVKGESGDVEIFRIRRLQPYV